MFNLLLANSGKIIAIVEVAVKVAKSVAAHTTMVDGSVVVDFMSVVHDLFKPLFNTLSTIKHALCHVFA